MYEEFYNFIADTIIEYFMNLVKSDELLAAESFSLKLDDEEMVCGVDKAIKEKIIAKKIDKLTDIHCLLGDVYKATTIALSENVDLIVASQTNGMSNDFLCATLRNGAKEVSKPILMISSSLIDSAVSGSKNMSSPGMPFYPQNLMEKIKEMAENSSQLNHTEKKIIEFEMERRNVDAFCDKDSFYEYVDLLSIVYSGKIEPSQYKNFRLFPIKSKTEYATLNEKQIYTQLKQNNELFEKFSSAVKFNSVEHDFSKDFELTYLKKLIQDSENDSDTWSEEYYYSDLLEAKNKKQRKVDNPLVIDKENIGVELSNSAFPIEPDKDYLYRKDGKQTGKKRKQCLIIFNNNNSDKVYLRIECKASIKTSDVTSKICAAFTKKDKVFTFEFNTNEIVYDRVTIVDSTNKITYLLEVCIMDLSPIYFIGTLKENWSVNAIKRKINILDVNTDLIFNISAENEVCERIEELKQYNCNFNQKLRLKITSKEMQDYEDGIDITMNFGNVKVDMMLFPDANGSEEITGKRLLKEKMKNKVSFTVSSNMHMHLDSLEYFAKGNLLKELTLEKQILQEKIVVGRIENLNAEEIEIIDSGIEVAPLIKEAYLSYLNMIIKRSSLPSLVYLDEELEKCAFDYVQTFIRYYSTLKNNVPLTLEQRNTLLIGSLIIGKYEEIWLTPLHPLNVAYQLSLLGEKGFDNANEMIIEKLTSRYLLPYLEINETIFKVSEQASSMEWNYYASIENKKYRGQRKFVPKLVEDKISEYVNHFGYLFEEIDNYHLKINLIDMGDCSEVFHGIAQYYMHVVKKNPNDELIQIEVNVYGTSSTNAFLALKNNSVLKKMLSELKLSVSDAMSMYSLEGILSKNISCYFHEDKGSNYAYAHISFYEMESNIKSAFVTMKDMETGISLNGLISGIPSSKYSTDYRTGFGSKYADESAPLVSLATTMNAVAKVGDTSNPYNETTGISTQIDNASIGKMNDIYLSSNWVVFVEPKVDLTFFTEKEQNGDLLIIHYSDQYTSSSGYDAITITHKTEQYIKVIEEQLISKGITCTKNDAASLINIFNSINGDWLLRLVSSVNSKKFNGYFDREKISISAGIKLMLAYLKNDSVLWVPVSLEEMLRVSGGTRLSSNDGVLSAKTLGFDNGATSDDLLFVGFNFSEKKPQVYLYPVEVKTGMNSVTVIDKAIEQAKNTYHGLRSAFNVSETEEESITIKLQRNFLIQLLITNCKKMKAYHIDDTSNWDLVIDQHRQELLNDYFDISFNINEFLGNAAVLSFKKTSHDRNTSFRAESINILEFAEADEYGLILKTVDEIRANLEANSHGNLKLLANVNVNTLVGDMTKIIVTPEVPERIQNEDENLEIEDVDQTKEHIEETNNPVVIQVDKKTPELVHPEKGMSVLLGTNQQNGAPVFWEPNNTDKLFHTNTGIIGTMGTGKTQFTKSLITQLYKERNNNIGEEELGILIFDYKGDYNENQSDFIKATNAVVLKPYHLPINPFAIVKPKAFKHLLPMHIANAFRDTLCKIYNLGPKQQSTIFNCVKQAYEKKGIVFDAPETWDNMPPTFNDVYQIYENDEEIKKGDSLSSVLSDLNNFELFEPNASKAQSLYDLLKGVVVIDLNGYDSKIQNLIVAITLDLFYSNMQAKGSSLLKGKLRQMKKIILVDEADNFMREDFPSLKRIMKEGREYGVGVVLSTQFLKHFTTNDGDYSKYILTWVVHNVADLKKNEIDYIFRSDAKSEETNRLFNDISKLEKHYSIVKMGNEKPIYIRDKAFWELYKEISSD